MYACDIYQLSELQHWGVFVSLHTFMKVDLLLADSGAHICQSDAELTH